MGALAKFAEATVFLSGREPLRAKPEGHWSLGKLIADTLLDEDDIQHIAILIIGLPGSGKSTTAISIAMSAARHMAEATGKNPTEFFNLEECLWISDEGNTFVNTLGRSRQKIFVLDEATSSIDTETEQLIQDAIATLMEGRTSFIIAHRLSTIVSCDKIFVFDKGKIVERGTHEQLLLKNGFYKKMWDIQNNYGGKFIEKSDIA